MKINLKINKFVDDFLAQNHLIREIVTQIIAAGGTPVLVGGAVRDFFLGETTKDFDIETYGLSPAQLEKVLKQFGFVKQVGKAFGVYLLTGLAVDWSLPRIDSAGRRPVVKIDPDLDFKTAFRRRDLTVNAIGIDLKNIKLIDPFNGLLDLENKILRYVDRDLFGEDPLRFYRVMQLTARLQMKPDQDLNSLCRQIDLSGLSKERISIEFEKLFLKAQKPALGLDWLLQIGRLFEIMPELNHKNIDQIGRALNIASSEQDSLEQTKIMTMWVILSSDLNDHSNKQFLKKFIMNQDLIKLVNNLVKHLPEPVRIMKANLGLPAYKHLAASLDPQNISQLIKILQIKLKAGLIEQFDDLKFIANVKLAGVWDGREAPVLRAQDLLDVIAPGPQLGKLLQKAYQIQLNQSILNKEQLKKMVLDQKNL